MKVIFDLPRGWEVRSCEITKTQIVIEPLFLGTRRVANVLVATAIGDAGRESCTVISVSGMTGALSATMIKESRAPVAFDKPEEQAEEKARPEVPPVQEDAKQNDKGTDTVARAAVEQDSHLAESGALFNGATAEGTESAPPASSTDQGATG